MLKTKSAGNRVYKAFIYVVLIALTVSILVPVIWVFLASVKENSEFYGNPWTLPAGIHWQNFVDAWERASMGEYMLNSVIVTALALVILLVVALPAAYCLSRFKFRSRNFLNICFMAGLFINVNYIVVPIFLMLRDGDSFLRDTFGQGFLLNNIVVLAIVYAATALPFTIYLLSGYFATLPTILRRPPTSTGRATAPPWCASSSPWPSPPSSPSSSSTFSPSGTSTSSP